MSFTILHLKLKVIGEFKNLKNNSNAIDDSWLQSVNWKLFYYLHLEIDKNINYLFSFYHIIHSYFTCDKWNLFHVIFWRCFIIIFIKMLDIIQNWSINYHVINAHQLLIQISNFSRAYKYFGLKFVRKRKFFDNRCNCVSFVCEFRGESGWTNKHMYRWHVYIGVFIKTFVRLRVISFVRWNKQRMFYASAMTI